MFVEIESVTGFEILNKNHIIKFFPHGDGTKVICSEGKYLDSPLAVDEVWEKLEDRDDA